ncbi:MAG TPA: bifunctional adenosylcobinamide kinase/adenosylcobinamide-phosphate guanylyltransferase [Egibacteraceae bacterium]|nr:bifunctional adenosylcobinamide kinase/adenosylcobinamide-phosphate guanylyltransferase [Egibacteraceae bacterium]
MGERVLVVGGTRSGKSAVAERIVTTAPSVVYVATAASGDAEMAERVAVHRARRPASWRTVEAGAAPGALAGAVREAPDEAAVLVDGLGGWLAARMSAEDLWPPPGTALAPPDARVRTAGAALVREAAALFTAAVVRAGPVVVVAEDVGAGLTPADPGARRFVDLLGTVVQALSAGAERVLSVVAGRVVELPPPPPPLGVSSLHDQTAAADLAAHGDRVAPPGTLDFAVNVHTAGPSPAVAGALRAALAEPARYPDDRAARAALAARHGREPGEVVPAAGAAEVFWLLAAAVRVRLAAIVHPAFTAPEAALRAAGVRCTTVLRHPNHGWRLDPGAVPAAADLVAVGNPNNPTGTLDDPATVAALCRPGRVTVVDEAFVDFVADPAASLAGRRDLPGLVVVRSVTKLWGLAGVRAGYAVAPTGLARRLDAARQPWPVSAPALHALEACAGDEAWRRAQAEVVAARRARLAARLGAQPGVTVWPSSANFLLVRVPGGPRLRAGLLERKIAVRPSTFPGLDADHVRVTVRDDADNDALVEAFADVLAELP